MVNRIFQKKRGAILVLALWSLGMLTIFALTLGMNVRQKIILLSRLEERNKLHLIAESGIKKAIVVLNNDLQLNSFLYSASGKAARHNNEKQFGAIRLGGGVCEISHDYFPDLTSSPQKRYGMIDEESKININKTDSSTLKNLIKNVLHWDDTEANKLAIAIIDWREYGESEIVGFYSDAYYENLEYPYSPKNADFEVMDELLLVKGMTGDILDELFPFITIYGDGKVNVNTATKSVLVTLGLPEDLVDKVLLARRGPDGIEATEDDLIFQHTYDIASDASKSVKFTDEEIGQINGLNTAGKLETNSHFYLIQGKAQLKDNVSAAAIKCIFNANEHKIEYWKEEYEVSKETIGTEKRI